MKKLMWRLPGLPAPSELQGLVKDEILSKEEAREIMMKEIDDDDPKTEDLKDEIKFLRKLVEKLSENKPDRIYQYVMSHPVGEYTPWIKPYVTWCSAGSLTASAGTTTTLGTVNGSMYLASNGIGGYMASGGTDLPASGINFSEIKTF